MNLDLIWPCFDEIIQYDSSTALNIIIKFGHPESIKSKTSISSLLKEKRLGPVSKDSLSTKVYEYTKTHISGCKKEDYNVEKIIASAKYILKAKQELKELSQKMIQEAKTMTEFKVLNTIPCVGEGTAARILAEIGDVSRFESCKALVAYAGIDPMVLQSGRQTGEHLHITKKGNSELRTILYLVVSNMVIQKSTCDIAKYIAKKKKDGLRHKVALIAGENKLLRVIYSMLTNGTIYTDK